jgi:hypothetical protein
MDSYHRGTSFSCTTYFDSKHDCADFKMNRWKSLRESITSWHTTSLTPTVHLGLRTSLAPWKWLIRPSGARSNTGLRIVPCDLVKKANNQTAHLTRVWPLGSSYLAYPLSVMEEAYSKDTWSSQGPTRQLEVEVKKPLVNFNWLHI